MYTEAQLQYIEEVLGLSLLAGVPTQVLDLVVLSKDLNAEEMQLLGKILGSVQIENFDLRANLGEAQAKHVLNFGGEPLGREAKGESIWWNLPAVSDMTGASAEVVALKKQTWNWLQHFAKERS